MKSLRLKAWAVVHEESICFATEEDDTPLAVYSEEFDGEVSAKVQAKEMGEGTRVVPCTIIYTV